jgi:hypothetical protein
VLFDARSARSESFKDPFDARMRELGPVEGRKVIYDLALSEGDTARLPEFAKALVSRRLTSS